ACIDFSKPLLPGFRLPSSTRELCRLVCDRKLRGKKLVLVIADCRYSLTRQPASFLSNGPRQGWKAQAGQLYPCSLTKPFYPILIVAFFELKQVRQGKICQ